MKLRDACLSCFPPWGSFAVLNVDKDESRLASEPDCPSCMISAGRFEGRIETEQPHFSDAPRIEILASNAIAELLFTFRHQDPRASLRYSR